MEEIFGIHKNNGNDFLSLYDDGTMYCSCYSYEIASSGDLEISKDEAEKLYLALKTIFEK